MSNGSGRSLLFWSLLIMLAAAILALRITFKTYTIRNSGMTPAFEPGDEVVVRRMRGAPERSDVVFFESPLDPSAILMKRVIALPGETVQIRDRLVSVDGFVLVEPYALHTDPVTYPLDPSLAEPYRSRDQFGPIVVPAGKFFVLGDNREHSSDSRYWGCLPDKNVRGKVVFVISPITGMHPLR